jgi:hypothetical protein
VKSKVGDGCDQYDSGAQQRHGQLLHGTRL